MQQARRLLVNPSGQASSMRAARPTVQTLPGWDALATAVASVHEAQGNAAVGDDGMVCDFCETVTQYVKIALENNQTIADVSQGQGGRGKPAGTACWQDQC